MKPLFTLLLTCMISVSLMGQQDVIELQKQRYAKKHGKSFQAMESRVFKKPDHALRHLSRQFRAIERTPLKADQAEDQTMDSILWDLYDTNTATWYLSERELFTYDANGNMTNYVWFVYDSVDMKILPEDREVVSYNAQGQPTEIIWMEWDKASGKWVNFGKFELTYDGEGNLIQEKAYDWDPDGEVWLIGAVFDMTYDGAGNLVEELWSFWDEDSAKLVVSFKDEYIYDGGRLTTWNEYWWEEGAWELTYYTTYTYDQGNLVDEHTRGWDFFLEDWGDFSRTLYTYVGNRIVTEEQWRFDWFQFMMVRQTLFENTWDADGNMTTQVESSWVEEGGAMKSLNAVAEWVNTWKSEWAFNKNFSIMDLYVPYWFMADLTELTFVHMPVSETGYFNNNGTWDLNYRQTAYYSDFSGGGPTGINDVNKDQVRIFPIPASDFITFSWDGKYNRLDLEIYDLTGKQIISRPIDNNEKLPVDNLTRGVYLYKLSGNGELIQIGKVSLK